ncbi:hypothetical protein CCC_03686 [Paramagnetospirillum magnetotacticum MS-1]|uniref:Uncharacterized protein n=1 Tax=Paramagnetospirillum magnetotacticum MS-1 TaxID=272627 RepID=A0A0C2YTC3_PARME|nr:hypothetical protein [Paramagnetospirillum magnetotacticum]KIL98403.1 hypothetical protein CCC_03686 [Paramagnetospirillum magnetotacticum MS-1]
MSADELDEIVAKLVPPVEVAPERAAHVMDRVMARLDDPRPAAASFSGLTGWLAGLVPVSRFALPMAAAALLGIVVGQGLRPSSDVVVLDHVLTATSYAGLGY